MTLPTSQALTPTDEKLEVLIEELVDSACILAKHGLDVDMIRSARYTDARAALQDYAQKMVNEAVLAERKRILSGLRQMDAAAPQ